jgi:hypothetical protein
MRVIRTVLPLLTVSALCAGAMGVARAQEAPQQVTVPFSDPSRPGTLNISLMHGGATIRGTNRKDVLVEARASDDTPRGQRFGPNPRPFVRPRGRGDSASDTTGLRRLTQAAGFVIEESGNEVQVRSGGMSRGTDFTIQVPARTHLKLSALNDGPIVVEGVEGEIEVNNQNESITLTNVAGSVVANAMNGTVKVILTRLTADKAMAFTSFNGDVDVTLPASTKANLKMRSDHGEIFTDFDVQTRAAAPAASQNARRSDGRIRIEVNQTIQGAINGGGPEFELRTFNGNIYVRKGAQ